MRLVPSHEAILLCGNPEICASIQSAETGINEEVTDQCQVGLEYGRAPGR
jgi:hypothetical protein